MYDCEGANDPWGVASDGKAAPQTHALRLLSVQLPLAPVRMGRMDEIRCRSLAAAGEAAAVDAPLLGIFNPNPESQTVLGACVLLCQLHPDPCVLPKKCMVQEVSDGESVKGETTKRPGILGLRMKPTYDTLGKGGPHKSGQSQVTYLDRACGACYEDVVTLQVPMDYWRSPGVKKVKPLQDLPTPAPQDLGHEFSDQHNALLAAEHRLPRIIEADDVGVLETLQHLCLLLEALLLRLGQLAILKENCLRLGASVLCLTPQSEHNAA
ncbi:hypothetical protein FQN60_002031 [Etheostoma spectabile]|uniref:Uncharacterized protein n=1 Tax=Etheostoma spectabile TaxID=54343 RepID=A0A5J5D8R9_9PERO|nr:hypothetical protein FQN60_002031 [Etheostoma spectabile]